MYNKIYKMFELNLNYKSIKRIWLLMFQICLIVCIFLILKSINNFKILDLSNACSLYSNQTYRIMPTNSFGMFHG